MSEVIFVLIIDKTESTISDKKIAELVSKTICEKEKKTNTIHKENVSEPKQVVSTSIVYIYLKIGTKSYTGNTYKLNA